MPGYLFIADLHLHPDRPNITNLFLRFLENEAVNADALYILGDLFEFWIGDDDPRKDYQPIVKGLRQAASRTDVYFMHGNRDFLIGEQFSSQTGCRILNDPSVVEFYDQRVILMHGDTLCTDDTQYQNFRQEVRSDDWQQNVMKMPVQERVKYFQTLREASQQSIQEKPAEIMDVSQSAVEAIMRKNDCLLMIHGHTHRPATHHFILDNEKATRIVLGDWYENGHYLRYDRSGIHEVNIQ